jgi:hypothetical protein
MLVFDHVGALVSDLEVAIVEYENLTGAKSTAPVRVHSQGVVISFVGAVELIQPDVDTPLSRLLERGAVFYHGGYRTKDFDNEVGRLQEMSYIVVAEAFHSEVFGNRRCQFFKNKLGHLIEIIEE